MNMADSVLFVSYEGQTRVLCQIENLTAKFVGDNMGQWIENLLKYKLK